MRFVFALVLVLVATLAEDVTAQIRPPPSGPHRATVGQRVRAWWQGRGTPPRGEVLVGQPALYLNRGPARIGPAPGQDGALDSQCPGCGGARRSTFDTRDGDTYRPTRPDDPRDAQVRVRDACPTCGVQEQTMPLRDTAQAFRTRLYPQPRPETLQRVGTGPIPPQRARTAGEVAEPRLEGLCIGAGCSAPNRRMGSWTAGDLRSLVEVAHGDCSNCGSSIRVDRTVDLTNPRAPIRVEVSSKGPDTADTAAGRASREAYNNMLRSGPRFSPPPQPPRLRQR